MVLEGFVRVVLLRVSGEMGVLDDGFGRSSIPSVDGAMEVARFKAGGGAADAAGRTLLSDGKDNMDM